MAHSLFQRYGHAAMKVLLLYPEFPDTFWSFKHALKFIREKSLVATTRVADCGRDSRRRSGTSGWWM